MNFTEPIYLETYKKGLLKKKIKKAIEILKHCTLCPRNCKINRLITKSGICKTGEYAMISSYSPHFGEEAPLVGTNGSGTIFFTNCNLLCNFCQNWDISHESNGHEVSDIELAKIMLYLQNLGCNNINFVTPSHVVPRILSSLEIAIENGLNIPLVYNSGGYDNIETIKLLDGIIDIYMPDFKFWDTKISEQTCNAPDYPEIARKVIKEMYKQVGDLCINNAGIAKRGLLIRHLVLPNELSGTKYIMRFIAKEISKNTYVNIMPQYSPCYKATDIEKLSRAITQQEFDKAINDALNEGIKRLD